MGVLIGEMELIQMKRMALNASTHLPVFWECRRPFQLESASTVLAHENFVEEEEGEHEEHDLQDVPEQDEEAHEEGEHEDDHEDEAHSMPLTRGKPLPTQPARNGKARVEHG
eukprot:959118-Pyramimonas_sp.AAC.1